MRKFILFFVLVLFSSCREFHEDVETAKLGYVIKVIDRHEYIFYKCGSAGGFCHSESCKFCKHGDKDLKKH